MKKNHLPKLAVVAALLCAPLTVAVPSPAAAAPPKVATSIKPVQALVKMVMGDLGTPSLIVPATASPHTFTMKPSQARMLENADVVFWIGPGLENALQGPLHALTGNARVVELLDAPGLDLIKYEKDDHDDHDGHDEHADEHADHDAHDDDHDDHADKHDEHDDDHDEHVNEHDEHGDEHGVEHEHDHGSVDPHIWLSPVNARVLVTHIAETLSQVDPANAAVYAANAKKARQRIAILIRKTKEYTDGMQSAPYLVQHDGFGYLAREFGFNEVGHIQTMPGREPGAKHVAELLKTIKDKQVKCLFHETQFSPKLARRLEIETGVSLREIDPLGVDVSMSETAYVRIIQAIVVSMETCLYPRKSGTVKQDP